MKCYNCGCDLTEQNFCTNCRADVKSYKTVISASNIFYNEGLEKAKVRDLSGAISCLRQCLKLNRTHIDARNLLGLCYFEIGESVQAMNEWVISKNLRSKKNVASTYLNMLQNNPGKRDTLNAAIKKYNKALSYCYKGSVDIAVIQLKKVLSMNPKYVQAHQLLALLYMNNKEWAKAAKELEKCKKIDTNNTRTLRYLQEIEKVLGANDSNAKKPKETPKVWNSNGLDISEDSYLYKSGNEVIIQPMSYYEGRGLQSLLNLVIGMAVGLAAAWFLVLPAQVQNAKAEAKAEVKQISEQMDVKTATMKEMESNVKALETEKQTLQKQLEIVVGKGGSMEDVNYLLQAVNIYLETPKAAENIGECLEKISQESVTEGSSESFVSLYNLLLRNVGPVMGNKYYKEGLQFYQEKDYEAASIAFTKSVNYDTSNADAYFNLANSYRILERKEEAIAVYEKVIELFPTNSRANRSKSYLKELQKQ